MQSKNSVTWTMISVATLIPLTVGAGPAEPDLGALKGAIVVVIARGVVPTLGNQPVATQGTGFFVSKNGYLITANHLHTDLGAVDEGTVTYEVRMSPTSQEAIPASFISSSPIADVMVLYAPVGDRNVDVLRPTDRTAVLEGVTNIFTAGYPDGYQYSVDRGFIKSFATIAPVPVWSTSLSFKSGQSGSPILLQNGRVVAMARGADHDQPTIGLVVPIIENVPAQYWDGTFKLTQDEANDLSSGHNTVSQIVVQGTVIPTRTETRTTNLEFANDHCADATSKTVHVGARPGWRIDPATIEATAISFRGTGLQVAPANQTDSGFDIVVAIRNIGRCIKLGGTTAVEDIAAQATIRLSYAEIPDGKTQQVATFSKTAAFTNAKTPLPDSRHQNLSFSVVTPNGATRSFQPQVGEIIERSGGTFLDNEKIITRLGASSQ